MRIVQASVLGFVLVATAACGASTDSSSTSDTDSPSSGGADLSEIVAEAKANVESLYASTSTVPSVAAPPVDKQKLWVVSCGEASIGCAVPVEGAIEAAEALGWDAQICDGNYGEANGYNVCIEQGVTAQATVIATIGVDCQSATPALKKAKDAGIPTVTVAASDCPETDSGPSLYTAFTQWNEAQPDNVSFQEAIGAAAADYLIANTEGQAKVIVVRLDGVLYYTNVIKGFTDRLEQCASCSVVKEATGGLADYSNGNFKQAVQSAITASADANALFVPTDDDFGNLEMGPMLASAGRDMATIAAQGTRIDLIESERGLDAVIGYDSAWQGWALTDAALRAVAGELPPAPSGMGFAIVDKDHNITAGDPVYHDTVDFKSGFKAIWGVS